MPSRVANMCVYLESKWNTEIAYSCESCLEHAYYCTIQSKEGYISDEELVATSRRHMKLKVKPAPMKRCAKNTLGNSYKATG